MKLVISPRAALDLEEIGDYIARDNPSRAVSFIREIELQCRKIAKRPTAFVVRDDIFPGIRMLPHRKYLILFRITQKTVRIERVVHGARDSSGLELPE